MPTRLSVPFRALLLLGLAVTGRAHAQSAPNVATRPVVVEGISVDPHVDDVLGIARLGFQGVIASELVSIGYRVASVSDKVTGASPLVLSGTLLEEACDDIAHTQCRIAVRWELQERNGRVVYRVVTRAVDDQPTVENRRRGVVVGALHSLAGRRRFAMRLVDPNAPNGEQPQGRLGFKRCQRAPMALPDGARVAAAGLVLVESGSRLGRGALISADGLVLAPASIIAPGAPLRVRFAAHQVLPARVVAEAKDPALVLLRVESSSTASCLALSEDALAHGEAVFGVSSELGEDDAVSLTRSVVQGESVARQGRRLEVDGRIGRSEGAPLFDEHGKLAAIVTQAPSAPGGVARALGVADALAALDVEPAPISDPRLVGSSDAAPVALGFVRDTDDPAFVLTERYTYGTGRTSSRLRTAGAVLAGVGAAGVAYTWLSFGGGNVSPAEHDKLVLWNDVSWAVLGLGVAGLGASFVWPERHQVVDAQSARRSLVVGFTARGFMVRGELQ